MEFEKVTYGKLFCILAEQAQAMADVPLYITRGEICPGYAVLLVVYPTSRQCDPQAHEPPP